MKRRTWVLLILLGLAVLSGCGGNVQEDGGLTEVEKPSSMHEDVNGASGDNEDDVANEELQIANEMDAKRKAEPRQVPEEFPLPLPEGWIETTGANIFAARETEDGVEWLAEFSYEADPKLEGQDYEEILKEIGFSIHAGLASVSDGKSFRAIGHIKGIEYIGNFQFGKNDLFGKDEGALPNSVHMAFRETKK